ncbi:unnamed protein product [Rotaria sp. Silwood2]|nr:unnamed protein product [Rotaria sp. Silwood2]CAF2906459.1 unnamed protein product [Rotaria sp. Silwood2]CAF3173474.1 unnamed protein product [Rotaria sp. Silwood2]CAF3299667.1 unnamed protein product [Rotaria sp. Silwood2]CAF4376078.1 unnamed protein product [Rotaria sp. Silwood2]
MTNVLKPCRQFALVYLDDTIVFSETYDDHISHLTQVFIALSNRNFVLNPPKCVLLVSKINYLGHTISEKVVTPMKEKRKVSGNYVISVDANSGRGNQAYVLASSSSYENWVRNNYELQVWQVYLKMGTEQKHRAKEVIRRTKRRDDLINTRFVQKKINR